jgi:hypothetical protein
MHFFIVLLSTIYGLLYHNKKIDRKVTGSMKKEIFHIGGNSYEIESIVIQYTLMSRLRIFPPSLAFSTAIKVSMLIDTEAAEICTREYPLLVPSIFKDTALAHIVSRRQLLADIGEILIDLPAKKDCANA